MKVKGWLLDVRILDSEAVIWLKVDDSRVQYRCQYFPDLFAVPEKVSFNEFLDLFDEHPHIHCMEKVQKYVSIEDNSQNIVIKISVDYPDNYRKVVRQVEKYGSTYDTDLSHTQRFLADKNLVPLGEVECTVDEDGNLISISQIPLDLRVEPPPFKILCFELFQDGEQLTVITYDEELKEEHTLTGTTLDTLLFFQILLKEIDPDFLCSLESDMKRALKLGIEYNQPSLGIFHRKSFHLTDGRVFISLRTYRRTSLAGIVERIMYTREVPRIGSDWAAGRAIESRQCYEARKQGILLPRHGFYQPVMSLKELLQERDHGGLIFAPTVGLHENVAALDFESMFPHLILKDNISYENVRTDRDSEGFMFGFIEDTLQRRLYFKHLRKELKDKPQEWFWCETRQQALKEILFCTYGYSGCWANKFGNMDTFMEINKAARENLVTAMNIARAEGFHTLYGNSDSLFLQKEEATREDFENLAIKIKKNLNLPITVENHFKYLVLLPQKSDEAFGAINRYYGLVYDGEIVCRGIELRRRNTPKYIADFQLKAIDALLNQASKKDVESKGVTAVHELVRKARGELKQKKVSIDLLEAKTILRKKPSKYKSRLPHVTAAEAMDINGRQIEQGSVISYVYLDSKHSNPFRRISPAGYQSNYDSQKYIQLLNESEKSILLPFIKDSDREAEEVKLDLYLHKT